MEEELPDTEPQSAATPHFPAQGVGDLATHAPVAVEKAAAQGIANNARAAGLGINIEPGSQDDGWNEPSAVRLSDGTQVQLYKDGEALKAAFGAIERATQRICLEVYIFASDDTGRAFADLLALKSRQGVEVYVIYDSFGSLRTDRQMFSKMEQAGVHVRQFHPMRPWECKFGWRPFNRDHRKLLVIDGQIAGLGGLNIAGEYAGSWVIKTPGRSTGDFWRDNAIAVVGPKAAFFQESFNRTWNYIARGGRIRGAEYIRDLDRKELGVLGTVATLNSPLSPFLCRIMREARQSILLTMAYFAPDDPLISELCRAARRGARVRLMLPGKSDVRLLLMAARSFYALLMEAGVEIYERQSVILHTKAMLIDEQVCIIGSTNLDNRSIEYNCELSAVIRNGELGRQLCDLFENDVRYAKRIEPGRWRSRPWADRFGQWAVSRARYLL